MDTSDIKSLYYFRVTRDSFHALYSLIIMNLNFPKLCNTVNLKSFIYIFIYLATHFAVTLKPGTVHQRARVGRKVSLCIYLFIWKKASFSG